jgi:hypothetical protein
MDTITRRQQLLEKLPDLTTDEIETRIHELDLYFYTGISPVWAFCKTKDFMDVDYLDERFLQHYYHMCNYELLGRCKSFTVVPHLKFKF